MRSLLATCLIALYVGCLHADTWRGDDRAIATLQGGWSKAQRDAAAARMKDVRNALPRVGPSAPPVHWLPFFFHRCGVVEVQTSSAEDYLQSDLVDAISQPFLECRSIRIEILCAEVDIRGYRAGYFGDYLYGDTIVLERVRVLDESDIVFCFKMIAESHLRDAIDHYFLFWQGPEVEDDFRRLIGFRPNLRVILEGERPFVLDIDTLSGDAIGRYRGRWAPYLVHGRTFELITETAKKLGMDGAELGATDNPDDAQRLREDH